MTAHWYTYNSQPNKEDMLWHQLQSRDLEGYYPRLTYKPVNPRARKIRPFFPGYLFIHVDLEQVGISTLNYLPYSKGLVCFGGEPAIVHETLVQTLISRLEIMNKEKQSTLIGNLHPGDKLEISDGLFKGYDAFFDEALTGKERSRILIKTLSNQAMRIEISNNLLRKK